MNSAEQYLAVVAEAASVWLLVAIVVLSGLSSLFQKRKPTDETGEPSTSPPKPPANLYGICPNGHGPLRLWQGKPRCFKCGYATKLNPPLAPAPTVAKTLDWETEMRRLLGEETTPHPAPTLPPIIAPAARPASPSKPAHTHPPIIPELRQGEEGSYDPAMDVDTKLSSLQESADAFLRGHKMPSKVSERLHEVHQMGESTQAYARAQQLGSKVEAHLHQVDQRTFAPKSTAPKIRSRGPAPEARAAVALLHSPANARQAMVAALLLGPPKALEN